jgi:hypothetical protein
MPRLGLQSHLSTSLPSEFPAPFRARLVNPILVNANCVIHLVFTLSNCSPSPVLKI